MNTPSDDPIWPMPSRADIDAAWTNYVADCDYYWNVAEYGKFLADSLEYIVANYNN